MYLESDLRGCEDWDSALAVLAEGVLTTTAKRGTIEDMSSETVQSLYLTVSEAAGRLGITEGALMREIGEGKRAADERAAALGYVMLRREEVEK